MSTPQTSSTNGSPAQQLSKERLSKERLLCDLPAGTSGRICLLHGGKAFISRVAALGFTTGAEVTVLQNYGRGPLLVSVRSARVALGRGEAAKIEVRVQTE